MIWKLHLLVTFVIIVGSIGYQVSAAPVNSPENAGFPVISIDQIMLGPNQFNGSETFVTDFNALSIIKTDESIILRSNLNLSTVIGDRISASLSLIMPSRNYAVQTGPVGQTETFESGRLLISSLNVSGQASFDYVSVAELIPAHLVTPFNGSSRFYNVSIVYGNSTFSLLVPREVMVNNTLENTYINIVGYENNSMLIVSFALPSSGDFSFSLEQYLSSAFQIRRNVLNYYELQVSETKGIQTPNYLDSAIIGVALFLVIMAFLYIYYRRK
ncbi:MAG: hypothetical protein QXN66_01565 [Thermoplasmatales archaeon]